MKCASKGTSKCHRLPHFMHAEQFYKCIGCVCLHNHLSHVQICAWCSCSWKSITCLAQREQDLLLWPHTSLLCILQHPFSKVWIGIMLRFDPTVGSYFSCIRIDLPVLNTSGFSEVWSPYLEADFASLLFWQFADRNYSLPSFFETVRSGLWFEFLIPCVMIVVCDTV